VPKLGNLVGKRFWTSPAAQRHYMANSQGLPCERKRDRAGADRSELHDATSCCLEKSRRTTPARPAWLTRETVPVMRDGEYRSAISKGAGSCMSVTSARLAAQDSKADRAAVT
jgi:hypothetical protein